MPNQKQFDQHSLKHKSQENRRKRFKQLEFDFGHESHVFLKKIHKKTRVSRRGVI